MTDRIDSALNKNPDKKLSESSSSEPNSEMGIIKKPRILEAFEQLYDSATGSYYYPQQWWIPRQIADMSNAEVADLRETLKREKPQHLSDACVELEVGHFLYWLARMVNAKRILETGANLGYSTSLLACAIRDNHGESVVSIDVKANNFLYKGTQLESHIQFLHGSSLDVAINGEFDMLFLDSDHTYGTIMKEVIRFDPLLRIGGLICFHDSLLFDGIGLCIKQLISTKRFEVLNLTTPRVSNHHPRHPGITVARKVSNASEKDLVYHTKWENIDVNITPDRKNSTVPILEDNQGLEQFNSKN